MDTSGLCSSRSIYDRWFHYLECDSKRVASSTNDWNHTSLHQHHTGGYQLDDKGQLLLEKDTTTPITPPILTVSRLWKDGPTPTLTTHISIQNASKPQRIDLGSMLLEDGILIQTSGSVSHWMDDQDHVFVYAPSGVHHFQYVHALKTSTPQYPHTRASF